MYADDSEKPIVELVDSLVKQAIECGASDIHIEIQSDVLRIRFRIDGILYDQPAIPEQIAAQIISHLKVLASIDIAQKRIPQDGKYSILVDGQSIDLRVSTFPSLFAEKIVIRILDTNKQVVTLDQLGFSPEVLTTFNQLLQKSHGFILVTGPTGSGKTTTLYAALSSLNSATRNIITLEDPVEYHISGVTQGQINQQAGFTFAKGIRSMLRQDPDIVMIGEIRDKESARIAIEASLTGHLVLSTLHTNDAPSALMRLMDMGIEPFLINAALTGILAQRLVRTLCSACSQIKEPTQEDLALMKLHTIALEKHYTNSGCGDCNDIGYKGRVGIFELLVMSDDLRALLIEKPRFDKIRQQALQEGMQTLKADAVKKAEDGITTLSEVIRSIC